MTRRHSSRVFRLAACIGAVASWIHAAPAHALERPGRAPVVHPEAAAEVLLAHASWLLERGDASAALAIVGSSQPAFASLAPLQQFCKLRIEGFALLALGRSADAAAPLREARELLAAQPVPREVEEHDELALARAEAAAGQCAHALRALRRAGPRSVFAQPAAVAVQARCQAERGDDDAALRTLDAALASSFPPVTPVTPVSEMHELRARLLLERGMRGAAAPDVDVLARVLAADALAALAEDWHAAAPELSRVLVDAGVARFPDDARFPALDARLTRIAAPRAAAQAALRAGLLDDRARADAVELLRATGDVAAARRVPRTDDGAQELRQRLALAVDAAEWDRAVALQPRLVRAGLVDDAVAYALAWAHHEVGNDVDAERLLDGIDDAAWFERATQLRAIIAAAAVPPARTP
jgi:hypothetical protein